MKERVPVPRQKDLAKKLLRDYPKEICELTPFITGVRFFVYLQRCVAANIETGKKGTL